MGGGTIVMNMMNEGIPTPQVVIGLKRAGLGTDESDNGTRVIGAMTTMSTLAGDDNRMLRQAASSCGGWAIKNMATIGGNLFARAPSGDLGVALLAMDANLRLASSTDTRVVPIDDFYAGGRSIEDHEILTAVEIPSSGADVRFVKYGRKAGPTPSVVTVAISLIRKGDSIEQARVALGAMGPHPIRAERAESLLVGNALTPEIIDEASGAIGDLEGLTDAVASAWYRTRMAKLHVKRLLESLIDGEGQT